MYNHHPTKFKDMTCDKALTSLRLFLHWKKNLRNKDNLTVVIFTPKWAQIQWRINFKQYTSSLKLNQLLRGACNLCIGEIKARESQVEVQTQLDRETLSQKKKRDPVSKTHQNYKQLLVLMGKVGVDFLYFFGGNYKNPAIAPYSKTILTIRN